MDRFEIDLNRYDRGVKLKIHDLFNATTASKIVENCWWRRGGAGDIIILSLLL